ncbi:amidohydrolase family protein [Streptomyces marianii]|uniref:Uncharacterized protein n=1 Tax=Streptomyces marianii TaxID=1817406 RepID=A0A5R9DS23_9ACTN|nr:hypothetical protein [Streptomyces marianii]TLQ39417.1 hypothetical protein FEF34_39250 [Streptomyces marianii]
MTAPDDLHDTERTTAELAEVMFSGNVIEVRFGALLTFRVSLSGVDILVRHSLSSDQIVSLASGLGRGQVPIPTAAPPRSGAPLIVDPGEAALLSRALEARATLVGGSPSL